MQEVGRQLTLAFRFLKLSNSARLRERPGGPSTGPEPGSGHDVATTNEASADNGVGGGRSVSLLALQASGDDVLATPKRNGFLIARTRLWRFLAPLRKTNSVDHHQNGASPSTSEDAQLHSVDTTSSGNSQAVMVDDGDLRPRRFPTYRPRIPSGAGRTWFILLSMIGVFFLWFWLIHPLYDLDASEPTEQSHMHTDVVDDGALETNEIKELLKEEAPLWR